MNQTDIHFIDELKYCVEREDTVKATALLQFFPELAAKVQKKVLFEILKAPDRTAYPMLERLSRVKVNDPNVAESIRELIYEKSYSNGDLILDYIKKSAAENKVLYIRIAGELKIRESIGLLEDILLQESDTDILEAAMTALGRIGDSSASSSVAKYLHVSEARLHLAAINALAEMGGPSAIRKLSEALSGGSGMDLAIIDALAGMQDQQALEKLCELLSSQFVDLRNAAIDRLIAIGPKVIPVVCENLKSDDDDALIHSLNVLGNIGDITALPAILKVIYTEPANPNVRFAVYEAMERLPSTRSAISLAQGLTDPVESVAMAAAKAIDKNLSTVLVAGMRNIIEAKDGQSEKVVATLIDSGADNAFNFLLDSAAFQDYAFSHLTETAHPDTVAHFMELLKKKGEKHLSKRIKAALKPEEERAVRVMAVDDSKMMLNIYKRKLHDMGYDPETYELPARAIEAVKAGKPDVLITDLNMPDINGIQLSMAVRELYGKKELPIIMITTQSDIANQAVTQDGGPSENIVEKAGINLVLNKPFEDKELKSAIESFLGR